MFYKLLGMLVWRIAMLVLRRKYGRLYLPKPVLAGLGAAVAAGAVALARGRSNS